MGEWIAVEDRLPAPYIEVAIMRKHADRPVECGYMSRDHMWTVWGVGSADGVTHWQPLPAPPQPAGRAR